MSPVPAEVVKNSNNVTESDVEGYCKSDIDRENTYHPLIFLHLFIRSTRCTTLDSLNVIFKSSAVICLLFLWVNVAHSQEMMGLNGSNYAGTAGAHINPSSLSNFPHKWEVHLLTVDFMLENNYAYMPKTSLLKEYKRTKELGTDYELTQDDFVYSGTSFKKKSAYVNLMVKVPSVLFKIKDHRFAIVNNGVRFITSANKVNLTMPKINSFEGVNDSITLDFDDDNLEISKFRVNGMAWAEFGFTYSGLVSKTNDKKVYLGISVKRLHGYVAGYLLNHGVAFDFTPQQTALAKVDVEYGYIDVQNLGTEPGYQSGVSGKGFGFDLGTTIVMKRKYRAGGMGRVEGGADHPTNYGTRIGISLIDMGKINFDSNVQKYKIDKFTRNDSIADMDVLVNSELYQFPETQSQPGAQFSMRLPTALSVQVDYKASPHIFVNATAVQRIVLPNPGIDRANQLTLTPRYELRWLGLSMPLILYQYKRPRLGAALRIGPLWIGSDKIGSWLFPGKFSGTDFFLSLRILPIPKSKKKKRKKAQKAKAVTDLPCSFVPYRSGTWISSLMGKLKNGLQVSKFKALNNVDHGVPKS